MSVLHNSAHTSNRRHRDELRRARFIHQTSSANAVGLFILSEEAKTMLGSLSGREFRGPDNDSPFVTVDYDEFKPETYRGIVITWEGREIRKNSGDFVMDYMYVIEEYAPFNKSSMVDHYMADAQIKW